MDSPKLMDLSKIFNNSNIPWNVISKKKQTIVKSYLYDEKTFEDIAFTLYTTKAKVRYDYYAALTKLSEFAVVRKFLNSTGKQLKPDTLEIFQEVYVNLVPRKDIVEKFGYANVSGINKKIQRVLTKHNIKWIKFVKKQQGKVIFNIPKVLR